MALTPARLYQRCVKWGLATGAVAGAVTAAFVGFVAGDDLGDGTLGARIGLALASALYGLVIGTLVAVVPAAAGGLAVTTLVRWRHPQPSSRRAVERDLTVLFGVVLALLNLAALALLVSLDGWSEIGRELPLVVIGDVCVVVMLWRARSSIAEGWDEGDLDDRADQPPVALSNPTAEPWYTPE
ncbi:MAG: hypothetical protein ABR540_18265 [Acidimicrobiales bacterium]